MPAGLPRLSVLVVVYDMPRQAMNSLYSLSAHYQDGVTAYDYEVVVVENDSGNNLDAAAVAALGSNFRFYLRDEAGVSPVPAVAFGVSQCRGEMLGLIIDGARMLTPRTLQWVLLAGAMHDLPVVSVPGYHLGDQDQKSHLAAGHTEALEVERLQELDWRSNGYRLFQFACWSSGNKAGYLQPKLESPALFFRRQDWDTVGGIPAGFDQPGGGSANLYIYRKLLMREAVQLVVLPGEGSFHQFHGGVTTSEVADREAILKSFDERLEQLYGEPFRATAREPQLLGPIGHYAQNFLQQSLARAQRRFSIKAKEGELFWEDELFSLWTENEPSKVAHLREQRRRSWKEDPL